METRQVTQIKIYKLFLNDMRMNLPDLAAVSYTEDDMNNWLETQKVEDYLEDEEIDNDDDTKQIITWKKIFKKGTNMEWYNLDIPENGVKYGIQSQWINENDFELFKQEYPMMPIF